MAKVTGPLYSMSASGKIADAMVYFGWKGLNVVREWLKPANPQTADQGDVRQILGGLGRATKGIQENSYFIEETRTGTPASQTWVSYIVQFVRDVVMPTVAAYESTYNAYNGHGSKAQFDTDAAALGLTDFSIAYAGTTKVFKAGLQLFALGCFGTNQYTQFGRFNKSPYTTDIMSWDNAKVTALKNDCLA